MRLGVTWLHAVQLLLLLLLAWSCRCPSFRCLIGWLCPFIPTTSCVRVQMCCRHADLLDLSTSMPLMRRIKRYGTCRATASRACDKTRASVCRRFLPLRCGPLRVVRVCAGHPRRRGGGDYGYATARCMQLH